MNTPVPSFDWIFFILSSSETAVWHNFFHMNIFLALKGSKLFIISPADTQVDLEVGFKLFFFTDSCSPDLAGPESD